MKKINLNFFIELKYPEYANLVVGNIKSSILRGVFNSSPFGAPLKHSTLKARKYKGSSSTMALYDTGSFYSGLGYHITGSTAKISSESPSDIAQYNFINGNRNTRPRDPFTEKLPYKGTTIEDYIEKIAGDDIEDYVDKAISSIPGVT